MSVQKYDILEFVRSQKKRESRPTFTSEHTEKEHKTAFLSLVGLTKTTSTPIRYSYKNKE